MPDDIDQIAAGVPEDPNTPVESPDPHAMVGNIYLDCKDQSNPHADINYKIWDAVVYAAREKAKELGVNVVIDLERIE